MRIRTTFAAAACAVGIALSFPVSAQAADGPFFYHYGPDDRIGVLDDPDSGQCITLPEAADENVPPAYAPHNLTTSTATVFTGPDCTGDYFSLRPEGNPTSPRLLLRSVVFS